VGPKYTTEMHEAYRKDQYEKAAKEAEERAEKPQGRRGAIASPFAPTSFSRKGVRG
jgi:hypothetical protein